MPGLTFTKMHGCGNDYVFLDVFDRPAPRALPALARRLSDRHHGIGADGLILIGPSRRADCRMVMFNADGSRSEMCGNGVRCAVKLAWDHGHVTSRAVTVETGAGVLTMQLLGRGDTVTAARVSMGRPRLTPATVPVLLSAPGPDLTTTVSVAGRRLRLRAIGMGNPHAVCFVPDPTRFPVTTIGPLVEHHHLFPHRTNVEFVALAGTRRGLPVIQQRTWERGSGETQACGTGACATVVAAILERRIPTRSAVVRLPGGDLRVDWPRDDAEVILTGEAVTVFEGRWR